MGGWPHPREGVRMTALNAFLLFFGMALLGVPLGFGIVSALVGPIVVRILPEQLWDDVMFLILNGGAAATTFLIGYLALDLPLWVSLLVAFLIAMTSYTRR